MTRMPNNEYYPDYSSEDHILSNEEVALDKHSQNTPFLISSQIAEKTRTFAESTEVPSEVLKHYTLDWMLEYESKDCLFVPENRWAHEVCIPPIKIEEDLYLIKLSADVYFRRNQLPNTDPVLSESFNFVSRTLYQYVEEFKQEISFNEEGYFQKPFAWILRWLPKNNCRLMFFTNQDIENNLLIKTPEYVVDLKHTDENIKVPFFLHKDLSQKMSSFKHDSDILYMRVVKNEKE